MPVIFKYKGNRFFFYSNEGNPREPMHVHVEGGNGKAKFWVYPFVRLAKNSGFTEATLNELLTVITENKSLIEEKWNEHFSN